MQVKNIECQIARAQLRRYLTGEDMPASVVGELESHLRNCSECMEAAQAQRESLKGVMAAKITGKPAPAVPSAATLTHAAVETPLDMLDAPDDEFKTKKPRKFSNWKTLAYSGGLAIVLVLMSTVFQDPTALFGPRASSIKKDTPPTTEAGAAASTEEAATEAPTEDVALEQATDPLPLGSGSETAETSASDTTEPPVAKPGLETSGLIVADSANGTKIVPAAEKKEPTPQPKAGPAKKPANNGTGTIKVYPPDSI